MRILAVTDDTNLSVALGLSSRTDLDVTTVGSFEGLAEASAEGFDAVLIAYRTTEIAVEAAGAVQRLSDLPCVVVTPRISDGLPDGVVGLSPPIDISTVAQALHDAVAPQPDPMPTGQEETWPEARPDAEAIAPTSMPDVRAASETTEHIAPPRPESAERAEAEPTVPAEAGEGDAAAEAAAPVEPATDGSAPAEPVSPRPREARVAAQPESDRGPSLRARAARLLRRGSGAAGEKRRRAFPARERIDEGLRAAEELQGLIDALPELNERRALAARLVADVSENVTGAAAVVLWGPNGEGGLEALAHRGVPVGVVQRGASTDIPLLRDLLEGTETVVYRAEERFADYLEGLPGLRGPCVLGAALRAHDEVHGLLVASGDDLSEADAEGLRSTLELHTVALAVSAHIELLRTRRTIDLTVEDGEWTVRGD